MATAASRGGAQSMNSMYFKPLLRKAFHKRSSSPDVVSDTMKVNGEEMKNKSNVAGNQHHPWWWVPDDRTGIYYPKGHEKVIEDLPPQTAKDLATINWFSNHED